MKQIIFILFFAATISFTSCEKYYCDEPCGNVLIIDQDQFDATDMSGISISNISNEGYCLSMTIGFSGCDNKHDFSIIHDGNVAESLPPQITVALRDNMIEDCDAAWQNDYTFDLLNDSGSNVFNQYDEVIIHFKDKDVEYLWQK